MISVENLISKYKLFKGGEVVGVAVSGGIDSMSLLHFLNKNSEKYDIELVAINVDHCVRIDSEKDSTFVADYCKKHHIRLFKFKVDAKLIAQEEGLADEEACRKARYGVFDSLLKKQLVDKICIAHHQSDQVETVLLNIFRGTGLSGLSGISVVRGDYLRPMLNTSKNEITKYAYENEIPYVEDETNELDTYKRNFIRNKVLPLIKTRWQNVENNILSLSNIAAEDDAFISRQINYDGLIIEDDCCKIPLTYFAYQNSVLKRIIMYAFVKAGVNKDIEKVHIDMVEDLAKNKENGSRISVPNATVFKEYDFITIVQKKEKQKFISFPFAKGSFNVINFGSIKISKTKNKDFEANVQKIDANKLPEGCTWRLKQTGDMFSKLGSGSKKLKDYFIDKKVPARVRNNIPVLAFGKEIFVVAGLDISDKVKLESDTKSVYAIAIKTN